MDLLPGRFYLNTHHSDEDYSSSYISKNKKKSQEKMFNHEFETLSLEEDEKIMLEFDAELKSQITPKVKVKAKKTAKLKAEEKAEFLKKQIRKML